MQVPKTLGKTWRTHVHCVLQHMALTNHLVVTSTILLSSLHPMETLVLPNLVFALTKFTKNPEYGKPLNYVIVCNILSV
jgi:hypothetical protein